MRLRAGAMVHGGGCLARPLDGEGATVLVDGAIPGEVIDAEVTRGRGGVTRARAVDVVEASPDRVEAPCRYYGVCGGCDLQHVAYARQLQLKREVVLDAMRRQHVELPTQELPVHGMEYPWRYRWRGELHVVRDGRGNHGAPVGLGFNRARSWTPVAIDDCLIHHEVIASAIPALDRLVREAGDEGLQVLHLTAGDRGRELLVAPRPARSLDPAAIDAAALDGGQRARWLTGATTLHWRDLSFRIEPRSFIQVNQAQTGVLFDRALAALGDTAGARVVDAYAGIGMMSCAIARDAEDVLCIEENPVSARLGLLNARLNGVEGRVRYLCRTVETALPEAATQGPVDAVVLDPPRAGCAGSVTGLLALAGPERIVYVSCDPATLARDLHILAGSGPYRVVSLEVVDMFPQTHHVECVAGLRRG